MDTSVDARKCSTLGKLLLDAHVSGREFAEAIIVDTAYVAPSGLAIFLEAVAQADRAVADKVLRSWGIRR